MLLHEQLGTRTSRHEHLGTSTSAVYVIEKAITTDDLKSVLESHRDELCVSTRWLRNPYVRAAVASAGQSVRSFIPSSDRPPIHPSARRPPAIPPASPTAHPFVFPPAAVRQTELHAGRHSAQSPKVQPCEESYYHLRWSMTGLRLACEWPATGLRLACDWPTTGLRLAYVRPTTGLRLINDWPITDHDWIHVWPRTDL